MAIILLTPEIIDEHQPMITMRKRIQVLVDETDYYYLKQWKWFPLRSHSCVYAARRYNWYCKKIYVRMHRAIMNCPKDKIVHHKNGNTLDNRRTNLEVLTKKEHEQLPKTTKNRGDPHNTDKQYC